MQNWIADLRYALRQFLTRPLFTVTALLTLALGIAVSTSSFSIVNALLLRPLPVEDPEELVDVFTSGEGRMPYGTSSYADYLDLKQQNEVFTGLAAHSVMLVNLNWESRSELLIGEIVSGNYFDVLGIAPALGRFFLPEENATEGTHPVVVLSHGFWEERFSADPKVIGDTLKLNNRDYTIVGVAPQQFRGSLPGVAARLWVPAMMAADVQPLGLQDSAPSTGRTIIERRGRRWLSVKGRLKAGMTVEQAQTQLRTIMSRLEEAYPASNAERTVNLLSSSQVRVHPAIDSRITPAGGVVLAVVGLVLLIACANVANMFLARATARRGEFALRLALGAGRGQLIRQLLTESLLLGLTGGALGLLLSYWGTRLLLSIRPPVDLSLELNADLDVRVMGFALLASVATGILFGLLPALQSTRSDLVSDLSAASRLVPGGRRWFDLRKALVALQVALSVVLLVGAGLLGHSLRSARQIDVGFDPKGLSILSFNLSLNGYDRQRGEAFYRTLTEKAKSLPGVESAAITSRPPFSRNLYDGEFYIGEVLDSQDPGLNFDLTVVSPGYFDTLGVEFLEGRDFLETDQDDTTPVVIINAELARRHWPTESPLGKKLTWRNRGVCDVVGVVSDYKIRTVGEAPRPLVHFTRAQLYQSTGSLLVRSHNASATLEPLRREALALEPEVLFKQNTTMLREMDVSLFGVSLGATLLSAFSIFALFLASVGLYGVIAYTVSARTREIGTRMALGASRRDILRQVVRQGMMPAVVGLLVGLGAAMALSRSLSALLYEVSPWDPMAFSLASLLLLSVALLANYLPARRASQVDPLVALRYE